ncbi:uncharacterized protein B0H18DRAFT_955872 [Fomitopsis serialis]|uniref:uncharacterized protein n=1 Tax=Fomitopsis serialis TaxID=139415 RepID=UPI0020073B5D|nr:uncharacterized protein B0H18DRAFT_955872 [Neoantrodia serialis]KAH9923313.1 hypothetical protein B0H18DRAFT_955872 [Neoantrodia serialis]
MPALWRRIGAPVLYTTRNIEYLTIGPASQGASQELYIGVSKSARGLRSDIALLKIALEGVWPHQREQILRVHRERSQTILKTEKAWAEWAQQRSTTESTVIRQRVTKLATSYHDSFMSLLRGIPCRIARHLCVLGFQREVAYLGCGHKKLYEHPLGMIPEELDDEALLAVTPSLVKWMEEIRELKHRLRIRACYAELLKQLDAAVVCMRPAAFPEAALPQAPDILMLPDTKVLVETTATKIRNITVNDASRGGKASASTKNIFAPHLHALVSAWREERKRQLAELVPPATSSSHPVDVLGLARSVFRCQHCSSELRWQDALSHPHLYSAGYTLYRCSRSFDPSEVAILGLSIEDDVFSSALRRHLGSRPQWSPTHLEYQGELVLKIIVACGGNPDLTSAADLDDADATLASAKFRGEFAGWTRLEARLARIVKSETGTHRLFTEEYSRQHSAELYVHKEVGTGSKQSPAGNPLLLLPRHRKDLHSHYHPYPRRPSVFERWWIDQYPNGFIYVDLTRASGLKLLSCATPSDLCTSSSASASIQLNAGVLLCPRTHDTPSADRAASSLALGFSRPLSPAEGATRPICMRRIGKQLIAQECPSTREPSSAGSYEFTAGRNQASGRTKFERHGRRAVDECTYIFRKTFRRAAHQTAPRQIAIQEYQSAQNGPLDRRSEWSLRCRRTVINFKPVKSEKMTVFTEVPVGLMEDRTARRATFELREVTQCHGAKVITVARLLRPHIRAILHNIASRVASHNNPVCLGTTHSEYVIGRGTLSSHSTPQVDEAEVVCNALRTSEGSPASICILSVDVRLRESQLITVYTVRSEWTQPSTTAAPVGPSALCTRQRLAAALGSPSTVLESAPGTERHGCCTLRWPHREHSRDVLGHDHEEDELDKCEVERSILHAVEEKGHLASLMEDEARTLVHIRLRSLSQAVASLASLDHFWDFARLHLKRLESLRRRASSLVTNRADARAVSPPRCERLQMDAPADCRRRPLREAAQKAASLMGTESAGSPTVMAANRLICVETDAGKVVVFEFKQNLECICRTDHCLTLCCTDKARDQSQPRFVSPTTLADAAAGRQEGRLAGSRIVSVGLGAERLSAIASADDGGLSFYHSLGKVFFMGAQRCVSSGSTRRTASDMIHPAITEFIIFALSHRAYADQAGELGLKPSPGTWYRHNREDDNISSLRSRPERWTSPSRIDGRGVGEIPARLASNCSQAEQAQNRETDEDRSPELLHQPENCTRPRLNFDYGAFANATDHYDEDGHDQCGIRALAGPDCELHLPGDATDMHEAFS